MIKKTSQLKGLRVDILINKKHNSVFFDKREEYCKISLNPVNYKIYNKLLQSDKNR